jgi:general secretion pathway protein G
MKPLVRAANAAFTLIEIMLVIIIVVALMAVLIPNLKNALSDSKRGQAEIYVQKLSGDLSLYEMANSSPPSTAQGLRALVEMPTGEPRPRKWSQREEKIELDPWGMEYLYEFPGKRNKTGFDVYSSGPDRQPGTADDIGNWTTP